jgi:hypothetical protein
MTAGETPRSDYQPNIRAGQVRVPEVEQKVNDLRDQFTLDRLPTLVERPG